MRNVEPHEIPEQGEQINQTLLKIGKGKSEGDECIIIRTLVDSGKYKGRKLSCPFFSSQTAKLQEFRKAIQMPKLAIIYPDLDNSRDVKKFCRQFQDDLRNVRFSALVSPVEFETEKGRYKRYDMEFFDRPTKEREIEIKTKPTQFQR